MKNILFVLFAGIVLVSCSKAPQQTEELSAEAITDGVLIHITEGYEDPHRVLMPLKMAVLMSDDKDVLVYMDIEAVKFLVTGADDIEHEEFESAHTYIKQLSERNVGLYACPSCLKVAGLNPDDLMDGVQVAQKDKFFNFTKGRIISLDY
jgi:predicted peroxiredoxin